VSKVPFDIFDEVFGEALEEAQARAPLDHAVGPARLVEGEASAKLSRNLDMALDRQGEIVAQPITDETPPRDKRLIADVAHQIVKTAVGVDANRLQARKDDVLTRILVSLAREKQRLGYPLNSEERARLDKNDP